jgi:hypothetical protein
MEWDLPGTVFSGSYLTEFIDLAGQDKIADWRR